MKLTGKTTLDSIQEDQEKSQGELEQARAALNKHIAQHGDFHEMGKQIQHDAAMHEKLKKDIDALVEDKEALEKWVEEFQTTKTKELYAEFDEKRAGLNQDIHVLKETKAQEQMAIKELYAAQEANDRGLQRQAIIFSNQEARLKGLETWARGEIKRLNEKATALGKQESYIDGLTASLREMETKFDKKKVDYAAKIKEISEFKSRAENKTRMANERQRSVDQRSTALHDEAAALSQKQHEVRNEMVMIQANLSKAREEHEELIQASSALRHREAVVREAEIRLKIKG